MSEVKRRKSTAKVVEEKAENVVAAEKAPEPKQTTGSQFPLRYLSRVVVITSLLIVIYFTSSDDKKVKTFAKQSEVLAGKGKVVECSPAYLKEVDKYDRCIPKDCKRYVSDKIITEREANELLAIAKKGLKLGGSSGGASILDLHSGALSMGNHFINIYKKEEAKNLFTEADFTVYRVVKEKIKYAIAHHFGVDPTRIYLTHPTFFSEITGRKAVTVHDEYWHPHVDKETYKSFHYTTLLYLGDYNIDFKGGRFVFVDEKINSTIEPRKARLSMFTSGAENLHYVEKVVSGIRYAMTISFTCDKQYAIEDPSINKYLS
ncbi:2-oxoglutarate and iron-dependent oxygenase domain-containing protein 3 [Phthorimaea operculella]|nr:2-oxoglutarate and iron-dependent oxygenase domain-containing protein 3 [Phthorimaea operculella]